MKIPLAAPSGFALRLAPHPPPFPNCAPQNPRTAFSLLARWTPLTPDGPCARDWRAYADPPGTTYDPTIPYRDWEDERRGLAQFDPKWKIKVPQRPAGMSDKMWEKKKLSILRKMKKHRYDEGGELRGIRVIQTSVPLVRLKLFFFQFSFGALFELLTDDELMKRP